MFPAVVNPFLYELSKMKLLWPPMAVVGVRRDASTLNGEQLCLTCLHWMWLRAGGARARAVVAVSVCEMYW
jgi:hypothetical protein